MLENRQAHVESAKRFAERERGDIEVRLVETGDGIEINALYRGARGLVMTASQTVLWQALDADDDNPILRVLAQIFDGMRRDIQRWALSTP